MLVARLPLRPRRTGGGRIDPREKIRLYRACVLIADVIPGIVSRECPHANLILCTSEYSRSPASSTRFLRVLLVELSLFDYVRPSDRPNAFLEHFKGALPLPRRDAREIIPYRKIWRKIKYIISLLHLSKCTVARDLCAYAILLLGGK